MSALGKLSVLALRGLVLGACQAVGLEAGGKAVESVSRFLGERFGAQGQRLTIALERANDRAWDTLEFALAGESLWQRCAALFARIDDKAFRDQVRGFLDGLPPGLLDAEGSEFRRLALEQLRLARKEGALRVSKLDVRQLAVQAGGLAAFATPQAIWDAETKALAEIGGSFPGERYAQLRRALELKPADGGALLPSAARYFFRREIEADPALFQGLAFALLERQGESLERGLGCLETLLGRHSARMEQLIVDVAQITTLTHDEVLRISAKLDQILARHQLAGRELRPDDALLVVGEDERRQVRDLVKSYRALPERQRAAQVDLTFKVGQAEALTGDLTAARLDFVAAAVLSSEPTIQAEAHASAFQAALAGNDFDAALKSLTEAAHLDPARFAPFPLDKYRPERILGAGGFGVAYLCKHAFRRTRVVVKALWTAGLERAIDTVFNEAQVLADLSHPSIVTVLDCDYADRVSRARPYVVMEYFEGLSLADRIENHGHYTADTFLPLARQLAEGLKAAHARDVWHRDVKPPNVLVGESGVARLIDFGLAMRSATLARSRGQSELTLRTTLGASIAGTYKYAAPEQLGELPGVAVGPTADVYSFGRTCYFALLGTPEPDDDEKEQLPDNWRRLLSRCTARLPAKRPQSFAEVLVELERVTAPPATVPVARAVPMRFPPGQVEATCVLTLMTGHEATVSTVAFHPRGRMLATGGFDDRVRLWSLPTCELLLDLPAHAADVNCVAFHPSGDGLATSSDDHEVRLWRVKDGKMTGVLRHPERVYAVAFSPDGKLIATGCDDHKARYWQPAFLAAPMHTLMGHSSFVRALVFAPDGKTLATASGDRQVHLWGVPDGKRRAPLTGHSHVIWGVAFSPDGKRLATASQDKTARIWDVASGHLLFTLEGHADHVWSVAYSPDGKLLATASHDRAVRLWSAGDGRHVATLTGHTGLVRAVSFSPDGRLLASGSGDGTVKLWRIEG